METSRRLGKSHGHLSMGQSPLVHRSSWDLCLVHRSLDPVSMTDQEIEEQARPQRGMPVNQLVKEDSIWNAW